jgi:mono/diheme cytochrome c family protein/glucose/arabinose dehydrogenase/lysophospholipase L1-like esterase
MKLLFALISFVLASSMLHAEPQHPADRGDHLVFEPAGKAHGKHIVLLSGDEEYRSEEALPMLAQLLSRHHGFKCTVLFSLNDKGQVEPRNQQSLSHPEALDSADLILMSLRFRNWDDATMQRFEGALHRGTPIVALRTSTHAFKFPKDSKWFRYSFNASKETGWHRGFGRHVLGETWVNHHGEHKVEGCRSVVEPGRGEHPILRGVGTIFAESDVYETRPLSDVEVLLRGQVTASLDPDSKPVQGKNDPMQPLAWTRLYRNAKGKTNQIFLTTMGAASDLDDAQLRRLVVNACYWVVGMEVPQSAVVDVPISYRPTFYGFNTFRKGRKPVDFVPLLDYEREAPQRLVPKKNGRIVILGAGLGSRMMKYGHFETELQLRYPEHRLTIRNIADEGNTPGFRPHPGRGFAQQFAFAGAKELVPGEYHKNSNPQGHFETPDQWLTRLQADTILAFFGFNSAMRGLEEPEDLERFEGELGAFIEHTLQQRYDGKAAPQLAIVSPTAIEAELEGFDVPDPKARNELLRRYSKAMAEVCKRRGVFFVDLFTPSLLHFEATKDAQTLDGAQLNDPGYRWLADELARRCFGDTRDSTAQRSAVHAAVMEKNWVWHHLYKIPNGVHVYGRRYKPFGPQNYPDELKKLAEMCEIRDRAIWAALAGETLDLAAQDAKTHALPEVPTNYRPSRKNGQTRYLSGEETLAHLSVPEGYKIELFADERMFPELANPVQMSFDNKGRLWVGCMPSYPHWRPGDPRPTDSLLILEDTNGDGRADKKTVFADDLHLCIGFELASEGVYVSQADSLILLTDTNGDDRYDTKEYLACGFDDHDTHHAISAFCADPSGAIYMGEGVFLHSNIETVYGTHRGTNGGHWRYDPRRRHLERTSQLHIPNPWGTAFDRWGQNFFLHTSGTTVNWMAPGTVKPRYGYAMHASRDLLSSNKVRPTSGIEFVSSRHFPDEVQGDLLLCNTIGFLGIKQHAVIEDGTGYRTEFRQDLLKSSEGNFRPVDLEFAPDGSLYVIDWTNVLIGHMQHNARDPHRDHKHGRIYRITYPSRPLLMPARIHDATIPELLENLKLPEDRTRYRTRRELRGRETAAVLAAIADWTRQLDAKDPTYEHHLLEALWVTWGHDAIDDVLLRRLFFSKDHRVRAAVTRAVRYNRHRILDYASLLAMAAVDAHGRVRMEAITAASWLSPDVGLPILEAAKSRGLDDWIQGSWNQARATLQKIPIQDDIEEIVIPPQLAKQPGAAELFTLGRAVYRRDAHCATCHQANGRGLPDSGFPPLTDPRWIAQNDERLIHVALKGLIGPIEVSGAQFNGVMTPFEALLSDKELAAVLTFVKNSFGNDAGIVRPEQVQKVRARIKDRKPLPQAAEILKEYPHK